ncbi:hypothetical protein Q9252_16350 [Marinobacter salarius]|uniref:hypothetical protein n=1 Tax=Marinobacter salarius TaxID=1420917 RepID=UPI00273B72F6|nr:hypothetical protein [Marinobacter salarius]MDP4533716.1 hypothetical protein [Marinobacter salarius]
MSEHEKCPRKQTLALVVGVFAYLFGICIALGIFADLPGYLIFRHQQNKEHKQNRFNT